MVYEDELYLNLFFSSSSKLEIKGKIKQNPEDFIVKEIDPEGSNCSSKSFKFSNSQGLYSHCILFKKNIDTLSAVELLAKKLKINSNDIGTAGLKDAQASTYQRISFWNIKPEKLLNFKIEMKNSLLSLHNASLGKYSIKPGDLWGNSFEIRVEIDSDDDKTPKNSFLEYFNDIWRIIKEKGTPNYFGLQRFGSTRPTSHLVGRFLLQKKYKEAVESFLFTTSNKEPTFITNIRKSKDIDEILKLPHKYSIERSIAKSLQKSRSNFQNAIRRLPESYTKLFLSAYQSYLFNRTLHFYMEKILDSEDKFNPDIELPLIGYNTDLDQIDLDIRKELTKLLKKDDLSLDSFSDRNIKRKGSTRKAFLFPKSCSIESLGNYSEYKFIFSLPKGSYATVFLRNFFELSLYKNEKNLDI